MDVILKKYFWVVNLVVIAVCASLVGRATAGMLVSAVLAGDGPPAPAKVIAPQSPVEQIRSKDGEVILSRNIFCAACAPIKAAPDPAADSGPVDTTPQKSSLPLQVLATMVTDPLSDPQRIASLAVIRDTGDDKKHVGIYRREDHISPSVVVAQVVHRRVYIVNGRKVEYLDQDGAPPPPPAAAPAVAVAEPSASDPTGLEKDVEKGVRCTGAACEVDKSLIDKVLANTSALATSARFVPSIQNGKPNGFKLYAIRPGSIFAKIGLQNADLIKAINGLDMSTPDRALEAYTKLKTATHLTVQVERRGENTTLDYQIR